MPRHAHMIASAVSLLAVPAWAQVCTSGWVDTFGAVGTQPRTGDPYVSLFDLTLFDEDGPGPGPPLLYLCGRFWQHFGLPLFPPVARWLDNRWHAVGHGLTGDPATFLVHDSDGPGPLPPMLHIAGAFSLAPGGPRVDVAVWNGGEWDPLGGGLPPSGEGSRAVHLLAYDGDGPGPLPSKLFVTQTTAHSTGGRVHRLDDNRWTLVRETDYPSAAAVFDDGVDTVPSLFVAASRSVYELGPSMILRLRGAEWSELVHEERARFTSMVVHDDDGPGSGRPSLYFAGLVQQGTAPAVGRLYRYDGTATTELIAPPNTPIGLASVDSDASGPAPPSLFAMTYTGWPSTGTTVFRRDGARWTPLVPAGQNPQFEGTVSALDVMDHDGPGPHPPYLLAAGSFRNFRGPVGAARWTGDAWVAMGNAVSAPIRTLLSVRPDTKSGGIMPGLYVGGELTSAGGVQTSHIAHWDGAGWRGLASGLDSEPFASCLYDDGTTRVIVVGGGFSTAGGSPAARIAAWDGSQWHPLGSGLNNSVHALCVFDDGAGPALIVGGRFTEAGGVPAVGIARWRNGQWSSIGHANNHVDALAVFDDGQGARLIAGGKFTAIGGVAASRIAAWDGESWTPLGSGVEGPTGMPYFPLQVAALRTHDEGAGPALFVGGSFSLAGGVEAYSVARWRAGGWEAVGVGQRLSFPLPGGGIMTIPAPVFALQHFDEDGPGPGAPALYAAGHLLRGLSRWDGAAWTSPRAVEGGHDAVALTLHDPDGTGPRPESLIVAGNFGHVLTDNQIHHGFPFLAELAACQPIPCYPNCDGSTTSPVLNVADFICFQNRFLNNEFWANCDSSTTLPILNVADFVCFMQRYAAGCP